MENNDDAVLKLKKNISEILRDMIYFGKQINEKSQNLLAENETTSELTVENLEYVTLRIANLMKKVKGNMLALINTLRSNIRDVDDQCPDKLFDKVLDKLDLCQRANVILGPNNKYLFVQSCDKETMIDGLEQCDDGRVDVNHINLEIEEADTSSCENKKKDFNLGLRKRYDTEDTNDSWPDSLFRSSIVDVPKNKSNDGNENSEDNLVMGITDGFKEDLCESKVPSSSPKSDSSSTIIMHYQPESQLNLDVKKNSFLNVLSTSDTNIELSNKPVIEKKSIKGDLQNEPVEEQSGLCVSSDLFESVQVAENKLLNACTNSEKVTLVNIDVKDGVIITGKNNSDVANNKSDCSQATVVGDICVVKDPDIANFQTAVIGSYGELTQEINSGDISKLVMDLDNQIVTSGTNRVCNESDINGGQEKQDEYLNHSPWSVETLKLDSDNENIAVHENTPNKKTAVEQSSMNSDNTQLSMDSDVTDIVNNSNVTNYAASIQNESCNSDTFSDLSLLEDSNHSFEFVIMDNKDYCNASLMTEIENEEELCPIISANPEGNSDANSASAEIYNLKGPNKSHICKDLTVQLSNCLPNRGNNSAIVTQDSHNNDSAGSSDLMHVTKVETDENLAQAMNEVEMDRNSVDDLLQLLREVEIPSAENKRNEMVSKSATSADSDTDHEMADEILKLFENESLDDLTDTETITSDSDCIDIDSLLSSDNDDNSSKIIPQNMTHSPRKIDDKVNILSYLKLKEARMDNCFVSLQRLQLNKDEIIKCKDILDNSIDRLCDLNNLKSKRRGSCSNLEATERKRLKKRKRKITNSDLETSDSDIQITESISSTPHLPEHLELKFDDMLAKSLMDDLELSDQSKESSDESDTSNVESKRNNKTRAANSKKELSKEEYEKKSWRNDTLLREKLSSDSDSSSASESSDRSHRSESSENSNSSLKNRRISKYERDSDFNMNSDSESSTSNTEEKSKINTIVSSTDTSDDDSDIAFVSENKDSPTKNDGSSPTKGRRNIRALMSEESLAAETQLAHKEEEERINRLEDRMKLRETFTQFTKGSFEQSQSWSQWSDVEDPFVLDFDDITGKPLIKVHPKLTRRLKPHQKDGVQFMWDSCYESVSRLKQHTGSGCILAHCMGLGKTYQVLTLIHTLLSHEVTNTNHVLVVCPLSTVNSWKQEAKIAFQGLPEDKLHISTMAGKTKITERYEVVKKWALKKKALLVLGYESFSNLTNTSKLNKASAKIKTAIWKALIDPGPDLVICDEGHLLKNKTSLKSQALNQIKTKRRIMLTGTPLQNNLDEYYYMIQFIKPNLLGNIKEFKTNFVNPITNGQYEDSTKEDIKLMKKRTHVLIKLLKKTIQRVEDTVLKEYLPKMIDHALFIQLHNKQVELYNRYSQLCHERRNMKQYRNRFLVDYRIFQYICTHPQLLSVAEQYAKVKERDVITEEDDNIDCDLKGWWKPLVPEDAQNRIELGNKLVIFKAIIEECEEIGDKILVFSQSLPELQLIEHFLNTVGTKNCPSWEKRSDYYRMDGTVHPEIRAHICDKFNDKSNSRLRVLLMSTKVGGLGLNLTAANRVVIMTVNWNPSYDTQSVFRAYRFGQEKPVYVYRLISLGTMEEKVYQRTVTKLAIAHRVIDKHQITRHYQRTDLEELYLCNPTADEERTTPNVPEDKLLAKLISDLPIIFKYHEHQALLANNPADDLSEQEKIAAWEEFEKEKTAKAQPLPTPLSAGPSVSTTVGNGPTFNMAFNLTRNLIKPNSNMAGPQKESEQYYTPKNLVPFALSSNSKGSQNFIPMRLSFDTTITIDDPSTSTTTDKNIQTTTQSNSPLDNGPPSSKPKSQKQNKCSKLDSDKQTINILNKYAKNLNLSATIDGKNKHSNTANMVPSLGVADNTINSPNPIGKSNVMVANQMIKKRPANILKDHSLNPKRKPNNIYDTQICLKKAKTCGHETSRINSGQLIENESTPIILIDGDEEINSNKTVKYNGQVFSNASGCFNKNNMKHTEDIITLD